MRFRLEAIHRRRQRLEEHIRFRREFRAFASKDSRFDVRWSDRRMIYQRERTTNGFDAEYLYHLAWAARVLAASRPAKHVDIASWVYFPALLGAFIPVEFYEFQPSLLRLSGLKAGRADLTSLPFDNDSIASLSCMHTVEHVGLGRYGDAIDPEGDLQAMRELARVLAPGGQLLFVVPTGPGKVTFNAHRSYTYAQVLNAFESLELREFHYIPSNVRLRGTIPDAQESDVLADQRGGCGCYLFTKSDSGGGAS
ncbi:DUF268 domain-containing protein [Kribbella sp. NPDC051587]|uniref:DUF268 domain-containing protein n=1 Tax=Kribbella sp. NPDC051587 TaxID=3364119 RepID=UPI003798B19E